MISINFAQKNYRLLAGIYAGLVAVNVLLLAATAIIIVTSLSLRADLGTLDLRLREMAAAEEKAKPLLAERDRVVKDLGAMSGLMESRKFSWTRFLTDLETVFPVGVALDRVEYKPRERALTLDGSAQSPESLRNLVVGLERSASFKDPYLKHQSVDKGSIEFNVVASYQGHQAAVVAQGK